MNFYITKPSHTKYGRIKLDKSFNSLDDLLDECCIWVKKPAFEKPFICVFENTFCIRGWDSQYGKVGKFKYFPNGEVKDELKNLVLNSINTNLYEEINNRYYRWIGVVKTVLEESETSGNFNLFLTKPEASMICSRGIDYANIWLDKPELKTFNVNEDFEYQKFEGKASMSGKYFRKEDHFLLTKFWDDIVNSFDIPKSKNFLFEINDNNSKPGQSSSEFLKEYYFNLRLER